MSPEFSTFAKENEPIAEAKTGSQKQAKHLSLTGYYDIFDDSNLVVSQWITVGGTGSSSSTTLTECQSLTNEWGKKRGKIKGNAQIGAFFFLRLNQNESRRVSQRAYFRINQITKSKRTKIKERYFFFIFLISHNTAITMMAIIKPMAIPPTSCLSFSQADNSFSIGTGVCSSRSMMALNSFRCA